MIRRAFSLVAANERRIRKSTPLPTTPFLTFSTPFEPQFPVDVRFRPVNETPKPFVRVAPVVDETASFIYNDGNWFAKRKRSFPSFSAESFCLAFVRSVSGRRSFFPKFPF